MNNPFKVGDVVYHVTDGKGIIDRIDGRCLPLRINFDGMLRWSEIGTVSFKPWPAPCHERPFLPVLKKGDLVMVIGTKMYHLERCRTVEREEEEWVWFTDGKKALKESHLFYRLETPVKFN